MLIWGLFLVLIIIFLALDLGVFNKEDHVIKTKEASIWTAVWVTVALAFSGVIYWLFSSGLIENPTGLTPKGAVLKYITGYLIELSLSIDNVFVIAVIFTSFKIPLIYQHRVLFWGILGAIVFRALMILFGVALITRFDWIIYVFGVFLLYTAFKMLKGDDDNFDPKNSFVFRQIKKVYPITTQINGHDFFIKKMGLNAATPLFVALIVIELTDILFALDSIPAILAITADPFIVFTSNILAILGLRSMYFLISRMLQKFRFINYSLVVILAFVGIKMLLSHHVEFPEWLSLGVIALALIGGIVASLVIKDTGALEEGEKE
ncbi:TerC family protein [Cellulophaga baltica]|jgi:tellurite resistance protein TerC|uniref:Membrane protein n=1 Tax=Cellulophaga baltica 18 TaxID=1348584 RepID=A0AAU8RHM8_9FLAO|nr:TerC family protein [Cellulophaga baltica]AIZ42882.1 membrane protein [Cellulophaga baltica 18]MBA6316424.1 TerC family protein [Cellulophaga baltica]MCR1024302.1 TerC family protein [Cellulophaga baltica]